MEHLHRISRGFHATNIHGHLVLVCGQKGAWAVSVDGVLVTETAASLVDAEIAAELVALQAGPKG